MDQPTWKLTEKQSKAWRALNKRETKAVLYGGARGGGKSFLLCAWLFYFCLWTIKTFSLGKTRNPRHIAWMGRKQGVDFTATTLQTWRQVIPENAYELRGATERQPRHILVNGAVCIDYGGLDSREDIKKFTSAEYAVIGIDQAEEVTKDEIKDLRGTKRLTIDGKALPYKELFTANPAPSWLKDDFITLPKAGHLFIPALPGENPYLPDSYIDTLKDSYGHRPELLEAYLYGSWDALEGAEQIIKSQWLTEAAGKEIQGMAHRPRLVCDTARFGDDETVIYYMETTDVLEQWIMPQTRSVDISNKLATLSKQRRDCPCAVESTGGDIGAAVVDELTQMGIPTIVFNPQGRAADAARYYNLRAEAWTTAARMLSRGLVEFHCKCMSENDLLTLRSQLCAPTYRFRSAKTLVESKADIKERLGRSPDRADAYVIGLWSYEQAPAVAEDQVEFDMEEPVEAESYAWETRL